MPNWCNNTVEINHPDPAKMYALVEAINEGKFCNHIIPVPESLHITAGREGADDDPKQIELVRREKENIEKHGYANWYDFCVGRWGTKWDVEPYEPVEYDDQHDKKGITFGFDSAWSPPLNIYEAMIEQGYTVKGYYWESGMCYCGVWDNGNDDYYDYSNMKSSELREEIDPELDEIMCITENLEMWEEENAEEVDEDEE